MNALSTIAAAVKTAIAGATLGQPFTVERHYVPPDYDTAASRDLKVLVIGSEEEVDLHGENATRDECEHDYGVKVAIVKRVNAADVTQPAALAELDGLSDVREALIDFLKANANRVMGSARLMTLKNPPAAYDPATLDQKKTFVSIIAATYRRMR